MMVKGRKGTKLKGNEKSKGEKKYEIERKRDERTKRNALRRERKARDFYSLEDDEDYISFSNQLQAIGLKLKDIPGDGNCLFRSLSDQLEGNHTAYGNHRRDTVQYMREHRSDFQPFHHEETPFTEYLENLEKDGTFAGNDAIVAFARNNKVDVIIHQFNNPRFVISGHDNHQNIELHIAYHNGEHYSSLRRLQDNSDEPAYILHGNGQTKYQKPENKSVPRKDKKQIKEHVAKKNLTDAVPKDITPPVASFSLASELSPVTSQSSVRTEEVLNSTQDFSEMERNIIENTNCKDINLVRTSLADNDFDFDCTVAYLMQLLCLEETCSQDGEVDTLQKPLIEEPTKVPDKSIEIAGEETKRISTRNHIKTSHTSNRQRKELAKQEKKKRREESQREQVKQQESKECYDDVGQIAI